MTLDDTGARSEQARHAVALGEEVTDAPVQAWLLGDPRALVRLDARLRASRDRCPHRPLVRRALDVSLAPSRELPEVGGVRLPQTRPRDPAHADEAAAWPCGRRRAACATRTRGET